MSSSMQSLDESTPPMNFDTVAIVGVGLIGGSIGMALRERRLARRVIGIGRHAKSLRKARRLGAIDRGVTELARGVADAELVVFCTPVDVIVDQAIEASMRCELQTILTDTGSAKARIVARLDEELPDRVSFVGSHPLAGSEKSGVSVARPDLFDRRICVVTETRHTLKRSAAVVRGFWESMGARVIRMSPEAHDRALAYTSHLPHLAAAALSIALPEEYKEVVATGYRDTTRIAASDPALWTAIFLENAGPILDSLASLERVMDEFRNALVAKDARRIQRLWQRSCANRRQLD